ncbi:MAG: hypothetical protein GY796_14970 [Chloroflexi bacterium]|nr:hypothetical protein [Chloroflexota bacterium]
MLVALILTDWLPFLRGPAPETSEWYWPYLLRPYSLWLKPALAALLMWGMAGWWLRLPRNGRVHKISLLLLAVASFLLQLSLMRADNSHIRDEGINRVYSNLSSGFFQPAAELDDLGTALQNYPALMPDFPSEHAQTHPPGLIIANWLTIAFFERFPTLANWLSGPAVAARCIDLWLLDRSTAVSAALLVWSIIPLLAAALTIFPAYWLAQAMLANTAVKLATLLIATLPTLLLFAPKSVQLYAPLTLLIFLTFYRGLQAWSWRWFFLSGLLFSLATFLSLGNVALGLLLLVYALLQVASSKWQVASSKSPHHPIPSSPRHLVPLSVFALGAISIWLLVWWSWGITPWAIAQVGLGRHYELVTNLRRYDWWVIWNLVDVLVFAGWIVLVGFTAVLLQTIHRLGRKMLAPVHLLALSTAVLILTLNLSGSARGEVGRIWLFFMPLMGIVAAHFLAAVQPSWRRQAMLIGLQLLLTVSLALAWQPVRAVTVAAQRPSPTPSTPEVKLHEQFGETIQLNGYTIEVDKEAIHLTLFWEAMGQSLRPYTVFNQLLNEQGRVVTQQDNWPANGQWPPTCWQPGEKVVDSYTIPLPQNLTPGSYSLITGWYDAQDGRRLTTPTAQDAILLERWTVDSGQ